MEVTKDRIISKFLSETNLIRFLTCFGNSNLKISKRYSHKWTDPIEKAKREVGKGGDSQNRALCGSTGIPGYER